jgi:hypothetical protein
MMCLLARFALRGARQTRATSPGANLVFHILKARRGLRAQPWIVSNPMKIRGLMKN